MSNFEGLYKIRDFNQEDTNFVLATFLRGVYYGDSWFSLIPKSIFMDNYKRVAESFIDNPHVTIKVACLPEDEDVILGYSILSSDFQTIHWVYVKNSKLADGSCWRQKGIAKSLVPKSPVSVTHLSKLGLILLKKFPNAVFDPFNIKPKGA